jgi:hypothetical protein
VAKHAGGRADDCGDVLDAPTRNHLYTVQLLRTRRSRIPGWHDLTKPVLIRVGRAALVGNLRRRGRRNQTSLPTAAAVSVRPLLLRDTPWRFKSSHPHSQIRQLRGPILALVVDLRRVDGRTLTLSFLVTSEEALFVQERIQHLVRTEIDRLGELGMIIGQIEPIGRGATYED